MSLLCAGRRKLCKEPLLFADLKVTAVSPLSALESTYPQYRQYFTAAEKKITHSLSELAQVRPTGVSFSQGADVCISGISYLFFTNGIPFYEEEKNKDEVETA